MSDKVMITQEQAHANGILISLSGIQARIYNGMSEEETVTKPLRKDNKRKPKRHKGDLSEAEIQRILDVEIQPPNQSWF